MDGIHLILARSADALTSGNFKDAYFCYLDIIDAAAIELRKVKFIGNVAITSNTTASLLSITRSTVAQAQEILSKHNADIAAIAEPTTTSRKTSLSRHSDRIHAGQTKTVTMLTEQLQATAGVSSDPSPESSPVSSRVSSFSSRTTVTPTSTPVTSPPLPRSTPAIPPKPTRRPPLNSLAPFSPPPPTNTFPSPNLIPTLASPRPHSLPVQPLLPLQQFIQSDGSKTTFPPKPPLPPKPARLYRKPSDAKPVEDHPSLDEEDSDEDDEDEDDALDGRLSVFSTTLSRRASSPSIAIPTPTRRPGTPLSVPTSPTLSPSSISSGISSADRSQSFTLPRFSTLTQQSTFITVIPDGSVDPTNLVEAERISGDNEDQLDQKTYGPSDHIPMIPVTPLRTTHRTLVEKEKSCSATLSETRQKLQERSKLVISKDGKEQKDTSEDGVDLQTMQENLHKYTSMISTIMATITKVRELLYRSASITSILEFPAYLVAYQLTLVESAIFLEIPPGALLTHAPKTPHRTITASSDFFNYLTRMIEYSVLFPPEASGRAQCMHYWIKVAVKLHELENFQTLKAVLSALGTPPVKRLKRTWGFVPRKSMHKLETLSELMSEARNYGKYREMMVSLSASSLTLSPAMNSPVQSNSTSAPASKNDMLSLNGVTNSLTSFGFRAKEAARRPIVPFLGTFIMDITYLLAAVKKLNNSAPPLSAQISATSSLREKPASTLPSTGAHFAPEDDARIQELLMTLTAYQSGPKYSSQPPRSYIKSATKNHHHFRAPSLSSALHRTAKYRTSSVDRQIGSNITHQSSYEDEEDDVSGNGLRPTQQLIMHYLLTRPWVPERMVDELSTIREPPKNKNLNSGTVSRTSAAGSTHSWPGLSTGGAAGGSMYSQISTVSTLHRGSTGSNSGDGGLNGSGGSSRPTSVDE